SRKTEECIWPDNPTASIFRFPTARLTAACAAFHQSAGLCSAQPGWGTFMPSGWEARATLRPRPSITSALPFVGPTSLPRKRPTDDLANAEENFGGQLVEALVLEPGGRHLRRVEGVRLEGRGRLLVVLEVRAETGGLRGVALLQRREDLADLGVGVEAR